MCRQFHKLPSEILAEDADLLKLLRLEALGTPEKGVSDG